MRFAAKDCTISSRMDYCIQYLALHRQLVANLVAEVVEVLVCWVFALPVEQEIEFLARKRGGRLDQLARVAGTWP